MAGHSHAKNVRLRKGAVDAKRGKLFTKMSRLIIMAAKEAGTTDPNMDARLAFAVNKAKAVSVPKDTIEKAIQKGAGGSGEGDDFAEVVYEGYGPGGVAVLCEILTDNRNRTAGEVRKIFDRAGGNLGQTGCVGYLFQRKGRFLVSAEGRGEDEMMELALEAGGDDFKSHGDCYEILCDPGDFAAVSKALEEAEIRPDEADVVQVPDAMTDLDRPTARKVQRLLDALDDQDDVQNVFSNAAIPDDLDDEEE